MNLDETPEELEARARMARTFERGLTQLGALFLRIGHDGGRVANPCEPVDLPGRKAVATDVSKGLIVETPRDLAHPTRQTTANRGQSAP